MKKLCEDTREAIDLLVYLRVKGKINRKEFLCSLTKIAVANNLSPKDLRKYFTI